MSRQLSEPSRRSPCPARLVAVLPIVSALLLGPPAAAQESAWNMVFDVTEVNVVNVEVVVTDDRGRLVTGLTRDDFELVEDGDPVEISNFYAMENGVAVAAAGDDPASAEVAEAEAAAPGQPAERPIYLVIYVDTANIAKANRAMVLGRMREFLLDNWRPGMRVMLVSNDGPAAGSAIIRQGFTSVPHDLFVALEELSGEALAGPRLDLDRRTLLQDLDSIKANTARGLSTAEERRASYEEELASEAQLILQRIAIYSQQALVNVRGTLATLARFVDTMAGMPGRKSILYVSDGLDVTAGADLMEAVRGYLVRGAPSARFTSTIDSDRLNATRDVEELIARANAHRVTLNVLDASPLSQAVGSAAESDGVDGTSTGTWSQPLSSMGQRNRVEALLAMAVETGGQVGIGGSAVAGTLDGVLADFDNHYSLGYVAERLQETRSRAIVVKVRGRDELVVRHRSSLRDKTPPERAAEGARAALLVDDFAGSEIGDNPLEVALSRREIEPREDGRFEVPVLVSIPLDKLVLVPGEELHQARVSMFVAVRDERGRTSEVDQHLCPIRIANADVLTALGRRATCGIRLLMHRGSQRVAVSVLDATAAVHSTVHLDLDVGAPAIGESEDSGAEPAARRRATG